LSSAEAARRFAQCGSNSLPEPARRQLAAILLDQLKSPLIYLLLAAAVISIALGEYDDSAFIFLVLAINTAVGAVQEARAEANTAALRTVIRASARTRRDGTVQRLDSVKLVPGDIVLLEAGDRVPADLRLLTSADLQTDEASLTGESLPVAKAVNEALPDTTPLADRTNMLYAGSTVQRGRCEALVVATGGKTELGRIAEALEAPAAKPPLTKRLDRFSRSLGAISLLIVGAMVALQLMAGAPLRETFFVAIALAVSIIPEGLPVAVTVALSIATRRMARRNVIVRHLPAVEGLGACTVIATDKTGTLTVNQLTAKRVWLPDHGTLVVGGEGYDPTGNLTFGGATLHRTAHDALRSLGRSAALTNDASFDPLVGAAAASGDSVDLAFLVLAAKASLDVADLRSHLPRIAEIPFAAERKYAASLNRHGHEQRLHVKGAAEVIVPSCDCVDPSEVLKIAEDMAAEGYRVMAVATKRIGPAPSDDCKGLEAELQGLTLLGLVGFIDPLRPEAKQAVADCHRAGVAVKMITGDHAATALAIARELGIAQSADEVVTGRELSSLDAHDQAAQARIALAKVFARVEPTQKVQIVEGLRASGNIVAMTGDGVNDAPALQRADLGVAMGRGGTDVARDAADLVLTDDNFASVVAGIEEGRAAYANIRKVIYLLISTGLAEVVLFLLSIISGLPVPLSAVQLLWLNLVTNGGQDVALAFEKREAGLLKRPPRRPDEPIFDRLMIRQTAVSGAYAGAVAYVFFSWALAQGWSEFEARNMLLFLMVLFENVHVFNCRSETRSAFQLPFSNNWPLMAAVISAQAGHIGAAFVPGLREVLQVEPITFKMWLLLVPIAASVLVIMEIDKALRGRDISPE
jgi:magnesium-transporting ATPase (P-type)